MPDLLPSRHAVSRGRNGPGALNRDNRLCGGPIPAAEERHERQELADRDDQDDLADARAARDALAAVFAARADEQRVAALLNDLLARTARPRLAGHAGIPLHLHVDAPGSSWGGWLAASGAMALALLIAEHGTEVLGACQARGCGHVLLRTGPGPARRFCDSTCASRTRVAAHRAQRAGRAERAERGGRPRRA